VFNIKDSDIQKLEINQKHGSAEELDNKDDTNVYYEKI
jgi:hypothetical protein